MATTLTSTGITFPDATTQTTAAGAPTTTQVLNATAGASVGAVGTYAFLGTSYAFTYAQGATVAGSNLRYSSVAGRDNWTGFVQTTSVCGSMYMGQGSSVAPSGTWRAMGKLTTNSVGGNNSIGATLWLRIS
jgi:hypothetical protein